MAKAALLTRRAGDPRPSSTIEYWLTGDRLFATTLAVSIVAHAIALAVRFRPFDFDRFAAPSPPLEVALVNARTESKPTQADVLAQANLDGGGNTEAKRRAKTPLPVMPRREPAAEPETAPTPQPLERLEELEQSSRELMSQLKTGAPPLPELRQITPAPERAEATEPRHLPSAGDILRNTAEVLQLEAKISRDFDAYQQRPKRRFIGARASEYRFARYVEDWRQKIERIGNLNYPEAARQQRLYGSLVLTVSIRSDGSVENVEISRTSGHRILDAAAIRIVELAGPFAAFPSDIRRDTDILHISRTWTFTRGDSFSGAE